MFDAFTRDALAVDVEQGISHAQIVEAMARIALSREVPRTVRVDDGPEFIPMAIDRHGTRNA